MNIFLKLLLFCSVPAILLSIFAVPSLKPSKGRAKGEAWAAFQADGASYLVPKGFQATDPFTTGTDHFPKRWSMAWPSKTTRVAYLADAKKVFQIFLVLGERSELEPLLAESRVCYKNNVMVKIDEPQTWTTQDGVTVRWQKLHYLPGLIAGDDDTYVLGYAELGDRIFVVNAGGLTKDFDLSTVRDVVSTLTVGK